MCALTTGLGLRYNSALSSTAEAVVALSPFPASANECERLYTKLNDVAIPSLPSSDPDPDFDRDASPVPDPDSCIGMFGLRGLRAGGTLSSVYSSTKASSLSVMLRELGADSWSASCSVKQTRVNNHTHTVTESINCLFNQNRMFVLGLTSFNRS